MPKNGKRTNTKQKSSRHSRTSSRKQSIQDVMTPDPKILEATASVRDAAELMRESDIGDVVVLENNQLCGIVTDRDIVVRVLADGGDPAMVTVGDDESMLFPSICQTRFWPVPLLRHMMSRFPSPLKSPAGRFSRNRNTAPLSVRPPPVVVP